MKKSTLIYLSLILILTPFYQYVQAKPVSFDFAEKVAKIHLALKGKSTEYSISNVSIIENSDKKLCYLAEFQPHGFAAISSDSDVAPIIAYSFRNNLIKDDENVIYSLLKNDVKLRLETIPQLSPEKTKRNNALWQKYIKGDVSEFYAKEFQQWPPAGSTLTDGWVETRWQQSGVFNRFCPIDDNGQRSVVGCVATAMAMIIDFHQYIGTVSFDNSDDYYYGSNGIHIDDDYEERDFPSFPELNSYLNDLGVHYGEGTELTSDDIAALSFACGISVEMWYSSEGSGADTEDVEWALLNKFDYDSADWVNNYGSGFYDQLSENMISMQPAEMSIYTSDWNNGHAIICDGYNTDDYYHLNYGWGTSNSTCWYLLPNGMPYDYSIIGGAVMEIEGGLAPIYVQGDVNVSGASPVETYITLDGEKFYECYVDSTNGNFEFPAVLEGQYTATAILDRIYYDSQDIYIDEDNDFIQFNLGNFEQLTGIVSAPINPNGCNISLYQNDEIVHSAEANSSGYFSIPDVLPGDYTATASLAGNYFEMKEVTITLENQTINFNLAEYDGNLALSYSGYAVDKFSLIPDYTLSCAILLTEDELAILDEDLFAKVRFKAPINFTEGEIFAQIWKDDQLLSETQVVGFSEGQLVEAVLDNFVSIDQACQYYVGYKIHSLTGDLAYHDGGPRIEEKGAFIRTNGWVELNPQNFDYNFCIEAIAISQNFGLISGTVQAETGDVTEAIIKAENFISHPDSDGNYGLYLKAGIYNVVASMSSYDDISESISINNGESITLNFDFGDVHDILLGDVDDNGEIQAYDAALTLQYSAGLIEFEDWQLIAADVDGNGVVQAFDAALILQYSAGIIDEFPVESVRATNFLDAKVNIEKK